MAGTDTDERLEDRSAEGRRTLGWTAVVLGLGSLASLAGALLGAGALPLGAAALALGATALLAVARRSDRGRERPAWWVRGALWLAPTAALALIGLAGPDAPWGSPLADLRAGLSSGIPDVQWATTALAAATLLTAAVAGLLAPFLAARGERGLSAWLRGSAWIAALAAATALSTALAPALGLPSLAPYVSPVLEVLLGLVALEVLARALVASWLGFYDRVPHPGARVAADALLPRLLASRGNPVASLFHVLADGFGVDLRGTYALVVVRRTLGPLTLGLATIGWLATALVTVPFGRVGVAERFGAPLAEPLGAGLHLLPPWPLGRVELVSDGAVESIDVGYRGARLDADRLWTVAHADEEYTLLLGDGLELLSINARLEFRVVDPVAWVYGVQNPRTALAALAERELTRATVDRRLDDVLSENVADFGAEVARAVQAAADARGLGLEVLALVVQGLHPPLSVAEDYQAVVAAQVERDRRRAEAEGYAERERLEAEGQAATRVAQAGAGAVGRLSRARGEAAAFRALEAANAVAPDLFRLTAYLAALERALDGQPYHLVDRRIEADGGAIWLLE